MGEASPHAQLSTAASHISRHGIPSMRPSTASGTTRCSAASANACAPSASASSAPCASATSASTAGSRPRGVPSASSHSTMRSTDPHAGAASAQYSAFW